MNPDDYNGDEIYSVEATGDVVQGDEVRFVRAIWSNSYSSYRRRRRKGKSTYPSDYQLVTGKVVKESYGAWKQQHTFTILLEDGSKTLIKGRNLYRHGVWRKPWDEEEQRDDVADEKHERGETARLERDLRGYAVVSDLLTKFAEIEQQEVQP